MPSHWDDHCHDHVTGWVLSGLAGIVIKNGILLIEFTDELRGRGMRTREAAIQAGKIRIISRICLTAVATILGLVAAGCWIQY